MTTRVLQIASSFTCIPIGRTLRPLIVDAGIADDLSFAQYAQMTEYMLGQASDSEQIVGTIVLVRVEDWLREDVKAPSFDAATFGEKARQTLRARVDEFSGQVQTLASRGKPVWLLICPSSGWIADKYKLEVLCRTHTTLLAARVKAMPQVTMLKWPASLLPGEGNDRSADRLGQIPFTAEAFRQLGESVAQQVARTMSQPLAEQPARASGSDGLAAYLAGLKVQVRLTPAASGDRVHVDRLLRTAAAFSLTGEDPDLEDAEAEALLNTERCLVISVSDRLSDYGPSGVIAFRAIADSLVVDSMALSCPVLGKQVEFAVLLALSEIAAKQKCSKVVFEYRESGRNQTMHTFLGTVADEESDGRYTLPVNQAESRTQKAAVAAGTWTLDFSASLPHSNGQ